MRYRRGFTLLLAFALAAPCASSSAVAGEPSAEAKTVFDKGKSLFELGKFEEALVDLKRAVELTNSPNARLYVGRCLKALHRRAEAYEELRAAMSDATKLATTDDKYAKTRDAAAAQVAILENEIGRVVVVVTGERPGSVIKLGDGVLKPADLGVPRAVEPGVVIVKAELDGAVIAEGRAEVAAGKTATIKLDLSAAPQRPGDPPPPRAGSETTKTKPATTRTGGEIRIAGFVVGGLGVLGLVGFGVAGGLALDRKSTLDDECGGTHCPDGSHDDLIAEGRTLALAANINLGIGAGLLAASVFMIAFGGPHDAPARTAIGIDGRGVWATVALP